MNGSDTKDGKMGFVICYVLIMGIVLLFLGMEWRENEKYSKGKRNRYYTKGGSFINYAYQNYAYIVPHTRKRILEILSHKNVQDKLVYEWDSETMEIVFYNPESYFYNSRNGGFRCQLTLDEQGDSCILYVEQKGLCTYRGSSRVYILMDAFWSVKLDAHPYENLNFHRGE